MADVDEELNRSHCPRNSWSVARECYDLEYADDTVLFAKNTQTLNQLLAAVRYEASRCGLTVNTSKCASLGMNQNFNIKVKSLKVCYQTFL